MTRLDRASMLASVGAFDYAGAPVPVRGDIPDAHRRAWNRLAAAGAWWTGRERVAIAAEARNATLCPLCEERAAILSPEVATGSHRSLGALSAAVVDAVHRITIDPGRLSRSWFEGLAAEGIDDGPYVELVGVVATLVSIDAFHCALGLPLEPLPEPQPGTPSRIRPPDARPGGAWVPMRPLRGTGNVFRALSLIPEELRNLKDLTSAHYLPLDRFLSAESGRALSRVQMELIAGRVSALNECFY